MRFKPTLVAALVSGVIAGQVHAAANLDNYSVLADKNASKASAAKRAGKVIQTNSIIDKKIIQKAQRNNLITSAKSVSYNKEFGSPSMVWADPKLAKAPINVVKQADQARYAASYYLRQYAAMYGVDQALTGIYTKSVHDIGRGAIIVKLVQKVGSVDVIGAELNVTMKRDFSLVSLSGGLSAKAGKAAAALKKGDASLQFKMKPAQVFGHVLADMGLRTDGAAFVSAGKKDKYEHFSAANIKGDTRVEQIRSKAVYFHTPGGLIPAYYVEASLAEIDTTGGAQYGYIVSAQDGSTLQRKNLAENAGFGYRVFADTTGVKLPHDGPQGRGGHPHPTGQDDDSMPAFTAPAMVVGETGPISTNDPWLLTGATETTGNNVDAYADRGGANGFDAGDLRANVNATAGTGEPAFDYVLDTSLLPNANDNQVKAAVTNMFYVNNWLHDWFYDAGFDEAAGNAQLLNYGRGGVEGDYIRGEAQDFSGTNNANMSTPADGGRPRMQMYNWFAPGDSATVTVNSPGGIPVVNGGGAAFGPQAFTLTNDLVLYTDGVGATAEAQSDACEAADNAAALNGKIAVLYRGVCGFAVKVKNAQNAGAVGAIVLNPASRAGQPIGTMGGADATITIPSILTTTEDGVGLRTAMAGATVNVTMKEAKPSRDSSMDNLIIAHEWAHYLSNRLVGNSSGLVNNQGRSMGEGWSDFVALVMTVEAEDAFAAANPSWAGAYAMGGYSQHGSIASSTYYSGIRGVPYTTDMNKNPLTFSYVEVDPEVHGSGTLWASVMWEAYAGLLQQGGRLSFADAQTRMKDYLVASLKITPLAPTFTEARDALLAVAMASDPSDAAVFAQAFAKRGMGAGAISPDRFSTDHAGVVESYSNGGAAAVSDVSYTLLNDCDHDGVLDAGDEATLHFTVSNAGFTTLSDVSAQVDETNAIVIGGVTMAKTMLRAGEWTTGSARVQLKADVATGARTSIDVVPTSPDMATDAPVAYDGAFGVFNYNLNLRTSALDDANKGVITDWVSTVNADASDPLVTTEFVASNLPFTAEDDLTYVVWNQPTTADTAFVSPEFTVAAGDAFVLNYKFAYFFEFDFDGGVIEYSVDGGEWTDADGHLTPAYDGALAAPLGNPVLDDGRPGYLYANPASFAAGTVTFEDGKLDLTGLGLAGKKVKVRFRTGSDGGVAELGFLIDDISAVGADTPFSTLVETSGSCATIPDVAISGPASIQEGSPIIMTPVVNHGLSGALTYQWTQVSGPTVSIATGTDGSVAKIIAPQVNASTDLVVRLTVTDAHENSASNDLTIAVTDTPKSASSGSGGGAFYLPLLALLGLLRLRKRK